MEAGAGRPVRPTYSEPRVLECEWSSSQSGVLFPVVCPKESERETYLIRFGAAPRRKISEHKEGSSLAKVLWGLYEGLCEVSVER